MSLPTPYAWMKRVAALFEKRAFSLQTIFSFAVFVGAGRLILEGAVADRQMAQVLPQLYTWIVFYFHVFFVLGVILWLLVDQPWRKSMNVLLLGVLMGLMPPLIDPFVYGLHQFQYKYFLGFPEGWSFWILNPERGIPMGEAVVLWGAVLLTAVYVFFKTASFAYMAVAAVLAYGAVVLWAGLLVSPIDSLVRQFGGTRGHTMVLLSGAQVMVALVCYLIMQPGLFANLMRRSIHALPFVLICLVGAAWMGALAPGVYYYALVLFLVFLTALAQNDYHDAQDDQLQGRRLYLDIEDVRFLNIATLLLIAGLALFNAAASVLLVIIFAACVLYNYPFYRGRNYFPANLKMEAVWGAASFLLGVTAYQEQAAYGMPRWSLTLMEPLTQTIYPGSHDGATLTAAALVFGGFTLLPMLKDYKDVEADLAAGVQTVYTLGRRRQIAPEKIHQVVAVLSTVGLAAPFVLLALYGRIATWLVVPGAAFAAATGAVTLYHATRKRFALTLAGINLVLVTLLIALLLGAQ